MGGIFSLISGIFQPAVDLIDKIHTSDDERLQAKAVLLELQTRVVTQTIEYEKQLLTSQTAVITAEAGSDSWITRSWRPIVMLAFTSIVVWTWIFGPPTELPPEVMDDIFGLIKLGLGGYVGGRSLEKVIPGVVKVLKKAEET